MSARSTGNSRLRKVLAATAAVAIAVFAFGAWYKVRYSMDVASAFEIEGSPSGPKVLIATQGSKFKGAVVTGLLEHLKQRLAHVKVVDISALPTVLEGDWGAVVVIHTWESDTPPHEVNVFVERSRVRDKLVVLTTSGSGDSKLDNVDAVAAASRMADVSRRVAELSSRIDSILDAGARH